MTIIRHLVLLSVFILGGITAKAQQLVSPQPLNKDGKLAYGISVYAADPKLKAEFTEQLGELIKKKHWDIETIKSLSGFPDVVFFLGQPDTTLSRQALENGIFPVVMALNGHPASGLPGHPAIEAKNGKDAVAKAGRLLQKMYYTGKRPFHSVIFENGKEGYPAYRIPSIVTLPNGRIIAIAEGRKREDSDCAENDIVLKISDDQGKSWGKLVVAAESGEYSLNNPMAVYIGELGRILILFQEYPPKMSEGSTQAGLEGKNICRTYVIVSDDRGETWSAKKEITTMVKPAAVAAFASGPGVAIRVASGPDKGRIIVPLNASAGVGGWFNYLVYSDDLGKSWNIFPGRSSYGTNESQVVQISDTCFLVNARSHRFTGEEQYAPAGWSPWNFGKTTRCRGEIPVTLNGTRATWGKTRMRADMPDPLCQGTIWRYSGLKSKEQSRLLFVNPASKLTATVNNRTYEATPPARINGTVRLSYDEGKTWAYSKRIYGNRFTEFQYSVIGNLGKGQVGCVFEAWPQVCFASFGMDWLSSGTDKGK